MTDQDTQFELGQHTAEIFRVSVDKEKLGRNAYANYFQFKGQLAYLRKLQSEGEGKHVVFLDMDVLVVDSIAEVRCVELEDFVTIPCASPTKVAMCAGLLRQVRLWSDYHRQL